MTGNRFYFVFGGGLQCRFRLYDRFGVYFFDKTLQDIAGTEFRKFGHAVRKHVLDDVSPAYRCGELCDQVGLDRRRIGLGFGIDVLVDGEFIQELKNLSLQFRGSSNQRILHLKDGKLIKEGL